MPDLRLVKGTRGEVDRAALGHLSDLIARAEASVVILDPWAKLHAAEENSNSLMALVHDALREVRVRRDVAMVVMHHKSIKPRKEGDPGSRGATAIEDGADTVLTLEETDSLRHTFRLKASKVRAGRAPRARALVRDWMMRYAVAADETALVTPEDVAKALKAAVIQARACGHNAAVAAMQEAEAAGYVETRSAGPGKPTSWTLTAAGQAAAEATA